jgi:HK97 gp10 family phage protein
MSSRIEIEGLEDLSRALADTGSSTRRAAEKAVADEVEEVAEEMRARAPVGDAKRGKRGRPPLAESIEASSDGLTGEAKATARHAHLVEDGTKSHPAQPFARPAAETSRGRFPDRLTDGIRKAVRT